MAKLYPFQYGDLMVLGPEVFADKDGRIICWHGVNYVRQSDVHEALVTLSAPEADRIRNLINSNLEH